MLESSNCCIPMRRIVRDEDIGSSNSPIALKALQVGDNNPIETNWIMKAGLSDRDHDHHRNETMG